MSLMKNAVLGLTGTAAILVLVAGMMPLNTRAISPDDQNTVDNIHELTSWMKADCKKMTIDDFHLERDPPHFRDFSRQLAEQCISGN
ncbi:TPA: hypothetical protein JG951_003138 [Enterobacter hormaechei subsp. steigerwaltii]|nr:hypothetical protein [Enterobacter hormaechei subsp. steigerwaltii]